MKLFKYHVISLLRLAVPLILTGLLQSGVFFFETIFFARLSAHTLAAGALVGWLFGTLATILFGTLCSINVLVSHKLGAKDHLGIALVVRDGLWLALLLVIPAFLLFWNMSPIFLLVGQEEAIVTLAQSYLHALAWGLLPNFIMLVLLEMIIGLGHGSIILKFTLLEVVLNIGLSFILIFGKFGLPALGIAGAGWGMSLSFWITVLILCIYLYNNKTYRRYLRHLFTPTKTSYLLELLRIGLPMGMMYCVEIAFFFALTLVMGLLGGVFIAANQVVLQYMGMLTAVVFSIAQAITIRMGYLLGSGNIRAAKPAAYVGIGLSFTVMFLGAIVYWSCPKALIALDFDITNPANATLVTYAKQFLMVGAFFQIIESIRISLFGALRSLKDTHFTLIISILSFWIVSLPLGYFLATRYELGGVGLWSGMIFGAASSVVLLYLRFKFKLKHYTSEQLA